MINAAVCMAWIGGTFFGVFIEKPWSPEIPIATATICAVLVTIDRLALTPVEWLFR